MSLEIACFSVASAITALSHHPSISRIELCASPSLGGTTPSLHSLLTVQPHAVGLTTSLVDLTRLTIPINVMVRPARGGDFRHTDDEVQEMLSDIEIFTSAGADGFVFGVLRSKQDGELEIDTEACKRLLAATHGKPCTFHRAFDALPTSTILDQLEVLIELGFTSVLTSGGAGTAMEGREMLKALVERAAERIEVIVGGGVRSTNLRELVRGIHGEGKEQRGRQGWWHSSAITDGGETASAEEVVALGRVLGLGGR